MPKIKKPKSLADVTIRQLIKYLSFEDELLKVQNNLETCQDSEIRFYKFEYYDIICKMIVAISSIPYKTLQLIKNPFDGNLNPVGEFAKVIAFFTHFFTLMKYEPKEPTMNGFYFRDTVESKPFQRKVKFHLFEFGQNTVIQQHYLLNEWSAFFSEAYEGMMKMDFSYLPRLIAIIAWPEHQINRILGEATGIKEEAYKRLNEEISKKEKIFQDLPLDITYEILHHFFFSSPKCKRIIRTYIVDKAMQKPRSKKDTINTMA